MSHHLSPTGGLTLVLGATGKTGRRVASRLQALGRPVRLGSRNAKPPFDWTQPDTWGPCLEGVDRAYLSYPSDLPIPGSQDTIRAFVQLAEQLGVRRLVLLTGRGETEAAAWEDTVQASTLSWTIVRAAWFQQNFSEGAFLDLVQAGRITLAAGDTPEPFVHLDDLADVAVAALTKPGHDGEIYEVTGPRLLTFADVADELSRALGRPVRFEDVPLGPFLDALRQSAVPEDVIWTMNHLFAEVLDGRNAHLSDGIERALGRQPKDFADFVQDVAGTNTWRNVA